MINAINIYVDKDSSYYYSSKNSTKNISWFYQTWV